MRIGRLLGAGRTADVYELEEDGTGSGTEGYGVVGGHGAHGEGGGDAGLGGCDGDGGSAGPGGCAGDDGHAGLGRGDGVGRPGGDWVLRRYRDGWGDWGDATVEAEVMEYVRGHGYPVPRVRSATRTDMVLERLSGPTMLGAFAAGELDPVRGGAILARLLHDLHALPPRTHATDPAPRVLHLDLHPENVVITSHGPQVIDWNNAEEGPPGLDWGMSALILAQVAVDTADFRADLAHATLTALLAHQSDGGPSALTHDGLVEARRRRAATPTMSAREVELLGAAEELVRTVAGRGTA